MCSRLSSQREVNRNRLHWVPNGPREESMALWEHPQIPDPACFLVLPSGAIVNPFNMECLVRPPWKGTSLVYVCLGASARGLPQSCTELLGVGGDKNDREPTTEPEDPAPMWFMSPRFLPPFFRWTNWGLEPYRQSGSCRSCIPAFTLSHLVNT